MVVPETAREKIRDKLYTELGLPLLRRATDARGIESVNDNGNPTVTDLNTSSFAW